MSRDNIVNIFEKCCSDERENLDQRQRDCGLGKPIQLNQKADVVIHMREKEKLSLDSGHLNRMAWFRDISGQID